MRPNRSTLIGAGVGFALGMPLFEVFLLTVLAVDGEWFDAAYTIRYFTQSSNVIILLALLHIATGIIGGLVGTAVHRLRRRQTGLTPGHLGRVK